MREGKRFTCPQCGDTSPVGVTCERCRTPMLDEHGRPPLPTTGGQLWSRGRSDGVGALLAMAALESTMVIAPLPALGVAVVDDDCFALWAATRAAPDPHESGGLLVEEGALVEVLGPAQRGDAEDVAELLPGGYRDRARPLCFDGRPGAVVTVLL